MNNKATILSITLITLCVISTVVHGQSSPMDAWMQQHAQSTTIVAHQPAPSAATHSINLSSHSPVMAPSTRVLMMAMSLIGTPYVWGGNTPASGFDCSGLVKYVFHETQGLPLPRTSRAMSQYQASRKVTRMHQLQPGDLVFFATGRKGINHVGIYVGDERFVHAPNRGGTVRLDSMTTRYWKPRYQFGLRVVPQRG